MNIGQTDNIHALIKDLTSNLLTISQEFNNRFERISAISDQPPGGQEEAKLCHLAMQLLNHQRARREYFSKDLFHDPAWNMLIALFVAHHQKTVINVKTLIASADAPATTSLRWIDHMHDLGLIDRTVDMVDRRRVEVSLSNAGSIAMTKYLRAIASH